MAQPTSVEVLRAKPESGFGKAVLEANIQALKTRGEVSRVRVTDYYRGRDEWLMMYGYGESSRAHARKQHRTSGRPVLMWDLGYFGRTSDFKTNYTRLTLNEPHPWRHLGVTPNDPKRWRAHGIELREDANPKGPVIVIGMGRKSRVFLGEPNWEGKVVAATRKRFPNRQVLYRPKRRESFGGVTVEALEPIETALKGASLVICRHSNVAVDACIAGVPVECEDGAAYWLYRDNPNPTVKQRLDFLQRLAHWQYRTNEMAEAWAFIQAITERDS